VKPEDRFPLLVLACTAAVVVVSGIQPKDRFTWWLEVAPILLAAPLLVLTYRRFPLTTLMYALLALHACVLSLGGHYTYAEVPLGFWAQKVFHFSRNHYDRVGHFMQGFGPAILVREVLLRTTALRRGKMLFFLVVCVALAFSAVYELVEWWAALLSGEGATAFLGTQGDVWDTQWDMFMCTCGAIVSQLALARVHDRHLARLVGAASGSDGIGA